MFPFHRTNHSHPTARLFDARAQLAGLTLAYVLLSATAAAGPSSKSKSSFIQNRSVAQATTTSRPEVVMTITRRDFGDVFAGEELEAAFGIRNAGTTPLELTQKSSLGMRSLNSEDLARAVWNGEDRVLAPTAVSMRVAPT